MLFSSPHPDYDAIDLLHVLTLILSILLYAVRFTVSLPSSSPISVLHIQSQIHCHPAILGDHHLHLQLESHVWGIVAAT